MSLKINNVLLIQPPFYHHCREAVVAPPPLGLAYLAAFLEKDYNVAILDAFAMGYVRPVEVGGDMLRYGISDAEIADFIDGFAPDVIGISCLFSMQYYSVLELSRFIKKRYPKIPLVLGGSHVSYYCENIIKETGCDFIVIGEGEHTLKTLLDRLSTGADFTDLDGLAFKTPAGAAKNPKTKYIDDLDALPFPARHLLPMDTYLRINKPHGYVSRFLSANVVTSRGCPAKCSFCSIYTITGRRFRSRSPQNVISELKQIKEDYGIQEVQFEDDNLTLDRKRAADIFTMMIEEDLNLAWTAPNGVALWAIDENLVDLMGRSGCYRAAIAIESGDQYVLDNIIKKPLKLEKVGPLVKCFRKSGILTQAFFVIGFPDETMAQIKNTFRFARTLPVDSVAFFFASPYPGTELYHQCVERGLLKEDEVDFSKMNVLESNIETSEFNSKELNKMVSRELLIFNILLLLRNPKAFFKRVVVKLFREPARFYELIIRNLKSVFGVSG